MLTLGLRSGLGGPSSKNRSRSVADVVYSVALRCELIKIASEKTIPVANLGGEQVLCENNFPQTLFVTLQFLENTHSMVGLKIRTFYYSPLLLKPKFLYARKLEGRFFSSAGPTDRH